MPNEELISNMNDLAAKLSELDEVEAKLEIAKQNLAATQDLLATVKGELADANTGLAETQKRNVVAHDDAIYAKSRELADITARIEKAKRTLESLTSAIASATERHNQIEASLDSLRKKFA